MTLVNIQKKKQLKKNNNNKPWQLRDENKLFSRFCTKKKQIFIHPFAQTFAFIIRESFFFVKIKMTPSAHGEAEDSVRIVSDNYDLTV